MEGISFNASPSISVQGPPNLPALFQHAPPELHTAPPSECGDPHHFSDFGDNDSLDELPMHKTLSAPVGAHVLGKDLGSRRASVVDEDVRDAWITRGWTLRASIHRHAGDGLKELNQSSAIVDKCLDEVLVEKQRHLTLASDVNQQLRSTLVEKKCRITELRKELETLDAALNAARGVEDDTRRIALTQIEEQILQEEKQKQDMQLELSQGIQEAEDRVAKISATCEELTETNARNKKILKEQQAEIKERQKTVRNLQRQIQVLEGAHKSMSSEHRIPENSIPHHGIPNSALVNARGSLQFGDHDVDAHSVLHAHREKALADADSKSLLRGAQAEKYLQEQKRRLQEQKMQSSLDNDRNVTRNMEDLRLLPGLDLANLLGGGSAGGQDDRRSPSPTSPGPRSKSDFLQD